MTDFSSTTDISIQDVTALQILANGESSTLAKGSLSVFSPSSGSISTTSTSAKDKEESMLILTVGQSSFPLTNKTIFGTFDHRPNVFAFQLSSDAAGSFSVQIHLPQGIDDPLHPANADYQRLEDLLIKKGLLLTGIRAAGNEIAAGVRQAAHNSRNAISETANERSASTNDQITIDPSTQSMAQKAAEGSSTAAAYTSSFASTIGSVFSKGGEAVGQGMRSLGEQTGLSKPQNQSQDLDGGSATNKESGVWSDTKEAASEAGGAISEGASTVGNTISDASEKTMGSDFNELASKTGQVAGNAGKAAFNAFESTSMIYHGGEAAYGASKGVQQGGDDPDSEKERQKA